MFTQITDPTFTEQLTPFLPFIGTLVGAILVGGFAVWNRKRGATENRAPDVNELWTQQASQARALDGERRHRWALEDFAHDVVRAFHSYVRRVQNGGSTTLTVHEQKAHDAAVPTAPRSSE